MVMIISTSMTIGMLIRCSKINCRGERIKKGIKNISIYKNYVEKKTYFKFEKKKKF